MIIKFHDSMRCGIDLYMTFYIMLVNIICIVPATMLSQSYIFLKPNIEIYRQSFQYAAPKFYNALPTDITAPSENTFM